MIDHDRARELQAAADRRRDAADVLAEVRADLAETILNVTTLMDACERAGDEDARRWWSAELAAYHHVLSAIDARWPQGPR